MVKSANPYMPLWEHVPDGEPRVFEYMGKKRVYVYGSHDSLETEYCGLEYVVWSAPVDDLTDWICHGVCFTARDGMPLYAPDVVQRGDTFYMYVSEARGSKCAVAKSKNPAGPFLDPVDTEIGFDPGVLVDDDGKVYAFWGFCGTHCAELDADMTTIKYDTYRKNHIGHCLAPWSPDDGCDDPDFSFFEASSPRKVLGKYVYIYSKNYNRSVPELGVVANNNGFLSYAYSDSPMDGYVFGGDISFNGGEIITLPHGEQRMTYQWGNNHGSIVEINGQWYIFYHRQTGLDEFSRQAMMEPVDVALDENGRLFIGKIDYADGRPVRCMPVEMTSQGPCINGIDARLMISAGYACHIYDGKDIATTEKKDRAYIKPVRDKKPGISSPIVNIKSDTTIGFRYLQFGSKSPKGLEVYMNAKKELRLQVLVDAYDGKVVADTVLRGEGLFSLELSAPLIGKRAVYLKLVATTKDESDPEIAEVDSIRFVDEMIDDI